ncbi:MAG: exodeoxyribonuclease III [Propionibacteriaceae bacterium]|nr:exodeoxyribonuclease III [Propionibacteriaceae bacterium]
MLIGTHNVNGIRATLNRGWAQWLADRGLDVLALQEVRCRAADLPAGAFGDYVATLDLGTLAGRNGVALLTRKPPLRVRTFSGTALQIIDNTHSQIEADQIASKELKPYADEGRYIEIDLADQPLRVASLYLPKGASWPADGDAAKPKYDRKMAFLAGFAKLLTKTRREAAAEGRDFLVMGDFNIANTRQDLRNWRGNQKSEGFLPEEREWFTSILGDRTLHDVVRRLHPEAEGPYSWWSWRGQAFVNDTGWRIDYHLASPDLASRATEAVVDREDSYEARLSDHAPVIVRYAS